MVSANKVLPTVTPWLSHRIYEPIMYSTVNVTGAKLWLWAWQWLDIRRTAGNIARKMFGLVHGNGVGCRPRRNEQLWHKLRVACRRWRWAGHTVRIDNTRRPTEILIGKYHGRRLVGRPRRRWEDEIRCESLLLLNVRGWRRLAEDRNICRWVTEEARVRCWQQQQTYRTVNSQYLCYKDQPVN
jgi:hypothetical protein